MTQRIHKVYNNYGKHAEVKLRDEATLATSYKDTSGLKITGVICNLDGTSLIFLSCPLIIKSKQPKEVNKANV
jgi:hypothetical protein